VLPARAAGGGSFLSVQGRPPRQGLTPPPQKPPTSKPHKQDLYVAVVKATIEEETVPKEKHVRS